MGKSYKDLNKQPKKISLSRATRIEYEEEEAEQDISKYKGMSFSVVSKLEEDE